MPFVKFFCFVVFWTLPAITSKDSNFNYVVWDVGQGSWSTYLKKGNCYHFDMGGEKVNLKKISKLCEKKKNWLFITHDDWDHISFAEKFRRRVKNICLSYPRKSKYRVLKRLLPCPKIPHWIKIISTGTDKKDRNATSLIYLIDKKVLVTGDAPMSEEKKWTHKLPTHLPLLILGHHGSRTSTSPILLNHLKPLMAIASARKKKYGHPHRFVIKKLKQAKVSLLRTETLGDIYLDL